MGQSSSSSEGAAIRQDGVADPARDALDPKHPGRRILIWVLIVLGLAVVVDRIADWYVGNQLTTAMEEELDGEDVTADIAGFPFLTQVIGGTLSQVDIGAAQLEQDGYVLEDVTGQARDVTLSPVTFGSLEASGNIPTQSLQTYMDRVVDDALEGWPLGEATVDTAENNLTLQVRALGTVDVAIGINPIPRGTSLGFELNDVRVAGAQIDTEDLPFGLSDIVDDAIATLDFPLDMLPPGLEIAEVTVTETGIDVGLTGSDVELD